MAEAAWHPWHNVPARWCDPRLRSKEVSRIPTRYADHRSPEDQQGPPVFHSALSAMTARCSGASLSGFGSGLALGPMGRPHGRPDFAVRLIKGASRPASPSLILGRGPPRQGSLRDSAPLRVLACLRQPLTCLASTGLGLPKVERERLSFVRDPCASERKTGVLSGNDRIDRTMI